MSHVTSLSTWRAARVAVAVLLLGLACSSDDEVRPSIDASGVVDAADKTDGRPPGALCGGLAGNRCGEDSFCDYLGHSCGSGDAAGECALRPSSCEGIYAPVCGCDGIVYGNECAAQIAGVDASNTVPCTAPPDYTRCGYRFCAATQRCEMTGAGAEVEYTCR